MKSLRVALLLPLVMCTPQPPPNLSAPLQASPTEAINRRFVQQFRDSIAGHENEPAGVVFKNIQLEWFKSIPARQFLAVMSGGYARALGVSCTHCHVATDFTSDDKRPKRAAREMAVMHRMINEQLAKMQNLAIKPDGRFINCSTCHRGMINPLDSPR